MREGGGPGAALLEVGIAARTLPGERESGDLHLVEAIADGVLVAVVDGLGHGAEAAAAARTAVDALRRHAAAPILALPRACHAELAGTRGVVMSVARIDAMQRELTWLGVGNVEGILRFTGADARPGRTTLITSGGIVGSELPRVRAEVVPITPGDLLVFATDGIRAGFADDLAAEASSQQLADRILERYVKGTDDALVLVARFRGGDG